MASARMRSSMNLRSLTDALREFERMPTVETSERLGHVVDDAFLDTQRRVHVDTGLLKSSGEVTTSEYGSEWRGRISYGRQAYYTPWEFSREGHNPFKDLNAYEDLIEDAVGEAIRDV